MNNFNSSKKLIKIYSQKPQKKQRMENKQATNQNIHDKFCSFCLNPSQQARLIIRATIIRLRRMYQRRKFSETITSFEADSEKVPIQRLVRILFDKNRFELKMSQLCPHIKLQNLLLQKLKCKIYQLETLIDQLCDSIARRNYQLQIICMQIKNIQNSALEYQSVPQEPKVHLKKNILENEHSQSKQHYEKVQKFDIVKIEEIQHQKQFQQQGSPPTSLNYNVTFENIPFAYNYLFYGGPFYQ